VWSRLSRFSRPTTGANGADLKIVPDLPEGVGSDWSERLPEGSPQAPAPGC